MSSEKTKTKVVCTIGPATSSIRIIKRLIEAGMAVARLNFSHGSTGEHAARIRSIRKASHDMKIPIGILVDLPGPKIRVGRVFPEPILLREGSLLTLTGRHLIGNQNVVSISHPSILKRLKRGDSVYLEDGTVRLKVIEPREEAVVCRVVMGGPLYSGKGVNLPERKLTLSAFTPKDVALTAFAVEQGVDFVGVS